MFLYLPPLKNVRGSRKRLPKFKFSAKFPIGLHVILQIQIKKIRKWLLYYVKNYFNRKSVEVQRWTPLEITLNGFFFVNYTVIRRCCHIESSFTGPPPPEKCWFYDNRPQRHAIFYCLNLRMSNLRNLLQRNKCNSVMEHQNCTKIHADNLEHMFYKIMKLVA